MFGNPYDRCGNQRHDSGAYPTEHRFHGRKRLVSGEKHRNQQNNNDGRQYSSCDADRHAAPSRQPVTKKNSAVNGNQSGSRLRERHHIEELFLVEPVMPVHHFALNERQHGVSAADGERTNLQVRHEQRP